MATYYAAVEGDPLTTGEASYTIAKYCHATIEDDSKRPRRMILIDDQAFCSVCKSVGVITYGMNVRPGGRMNYMGREQAVGGDLVICNCANKPRIYARHARYKWTIVDTASAERVASNSGHLTETTRLAYDEQVTLRDSEMRKPLSNVRYRVRTASGEVFEGVTDSDGKTQRFKTGSAETLRIDVAGV